MIEFVRFENGATADFVEGCFLRDGKKQSLDPSAWKFLSALVKRAEENHSQKSLSYDAIGQAIWGDIEFQASRKPSLQNYVTDLNRAYDADSKVKLLEQNDHKTGYRIRVNFEAVHSNELASTYVKNVGNMPNLFPMPDHFAEPDDDFTELKRKAFQDSYCVHVLSGERGMGKTTLAQYFARECFFGNVNRQELKYHTVIWTSCSDQGLRSTIAQMKYAGDSGNMDPFEKRIEILKAVKKPCLLILDNYDQPERYRQELSEHAEDYKKLRETGCHILITSKVDMDGCYGLRQTKIRPLPISQLVGLFDKLSYLSNTEKSVEKTNLLIKKYLFQNTYLVILAAKLTEYRNLDELIDAFSTLTVGEMDDFISPQKDGERQASDAIMAHYQKMYDLSKIHESPQKRDLLLRLSLLPLEGMPYQDFFEMAYKKAERSAGKSAFASLKEGFWVFHEKRKVRLHPMVREMVLQNATKETFLCTTDYLKNLNHLLDIDSYEKTIWDTLRYAVGAWEACKRANHQTLDTALLLAGIASCYDIVRNWNAVYDYGMLAIPELDLQKGQADPLTLAKAYNVVGYGLSHVQMGGCEGAEAHRLAEMKLQEVEQYAKQTMASNPDFQWKALQTKAAGNLAGMYIRQKQYDKALQVHEQNKLLRQVWTQENPSNGNKKMLADSYKGVGTCFFYLSLQETGKRKQELLTSCVQNHEEAVKLFVEFLTEDNLDAVIAVNRMISSGIAWMDTMEADEQKRQAPLVIDYLQRMIRAQKYLLRIPPIYSECKICFSSLISLLKLTSTISSVPSALLHQAIDAAAALALMTWSEAKCQNEWQTLDGELRELLLSVTYSAST